MQSCARPHALVSELRPCRCRPTQTSDSDVKSLAHLQYNSNLGTQRHFRDRSVATGPVSALAPGAGPCHLSYNGLGVRSADARGPGSCPVARGTKTQTDASGTSTCRLGETFGCSLQMLACKTLGFVLAPAAGPHGAGGKRKDPTL